MTRALRIGAGAGFSADRWEPAVELIRAVPLDAIVFECLAERTIALGALDRLSTPDGGFDPFLEERFAAVLPEALGRGVRIVTNMGAANAAGAARATRALAARLGRAAAKIAFVLGDVVLAPARAGNIPLDPRGTV